MSAFEERPLSYYWSEKAAKGADPGAYRRVKNRARRDHHIWNQMIITNANSRKDYCMLGGAICSQCGVQTWGYFFFWNMQCWRCYYGREEVDRIEAKFDCVDM